MTPHLSPFAMWWAFPTSDYYGDSVAMGLAPVRPSRVPWVLNVSSAMEASDSSPSMESFSIAPPGGGSRSRKPNDPLLGHCDVGAVAVGVRFHHWGLGFRQSSFRPIARVSRDGTVSVFGWLPLFWHAVVPSGFHLQVSPMTQEHPSEFLLTASGIQLRVPRRTLSTHRPQAFTNVPRGTQPSPSAIPLAVDLPVAMGVQQLQVVVRLIAASTAPDPVVDVPGLLFGAKDLPAHHAPPLLFLPEVLDPASTCQGMGQLPDRPLLQVEFPLRIIGVGCTPDLLPSQDLDPRCLHQSDRSCRAGTVTDRAREHPVPVALALEVSRLDPLPALLGM